jgi:antitoxin YefM
MNTISYSSLRNNLAGVLDQVNNDHQAVIITRQNKTPAVIISLDDFKSYEETAYLMASPKNAERLTSSINEIESENAKTHTLIDQ